MLSLGWAHKTLCTCPTASRASHLLKLYSDYAGTRRPGRDSPRQALENLRPSPRPGLYAPRQPSASAGTDGLQHQQGGLHYLYGANAALAAIRSKKRTIYNVFNAEVHQESVTSKSILAAARKSNLEVLRKSRNELDRMSLGKPHNNIVLSCSDLPRLLVQGLGDKDQGWRPILANQDPMSASLALSGAEVDTPPVYVLLDEVTDPQNMGSILRSAYFLGCAGVVLSARNCCSITPTVVKVSSGASEFVPILHADSVVSFIKQSRKNGWRCVATVGREEAALLRVKNRLTEVKALKDRKTPVLLILGSEGSGLRTNVKAACTTLTSIASPARIDTTVESLNVGVAAAILLHQLLG